MRVQIDRGRRKLRGPATVVLLGLLAPSAQANSLAVTPEAAMASRFGLRVTLDDPAQTPPAEVWVALGPDRGLRGETALSGHVLIDPGKVTMSRLPEGNQLQILRLLGSPGPGGGRIILFLQQVTQDRWLVGAWLWDDASGRYALGGRGLLTAGDQDRQAAAEAGGTDAPRGTWSPTAARIEFEWGAATEPGVGDGYFRLYRGEGWPGAPRALVFERTDLDNARQTISHVQLGMVSREYDLPGTSGELYLDEFALYRSADEPESEQDEGGPVEPKP